MPISKLELEYIAKARKAFGEDNLKLCLIYLKKVNSWNFEAANLLVDGAYLLWQTDYLVTFKENDALELVKHSFNKIVDGSIPANLIRAIDYIRLSHIYLIEGNLHGALSILNVASGRGYLEDPHIVTQSSTILKKIGKSRDIRESMSFLVSAVKLLASQTPYNKIHLEVPLIPGSKLPLSYVYMHCVSHVMKQIASPSTKPYEKDAFKGQLKSMLVECHYLHTIKYDENILNLMKWINKADLWIGIGNSLISTPYILLMIDSYWEGYIRAPLENKAIELAYNAMLLYHMDAHIWNLLEEGMSVNPWNLFIREQLRAYEEKKFSSTLPKWSTAPKVVGKWTTLFQYHKKQCTKLQALYRAYCIRKAWDVLLPEYQAIKRRFIQSKGWALIKYDEVYFRFHCSLIQRWKDYVRDYKDLKNASALLIQTHTRRYLQQIVYFRDLSHVKEVNSKYLTVCYRVYGLKLSQYFQRWNARFYAAYQDKAADIVRNVIIAGGYNQVFVKGVQQLTSIYRIKKKYLYIKFYRHWVTRYKQRRKKHAKMTIRFFVRNIYRQYYEKQQEMKLREIERKLKAKTDERLAANASTADEEDDGSIGEGSVGGGENDDQRSVGSQSVVSADSRQYYMKHYYPILELYFKKWNEEYWKRVHDRQFERAILSLQCRFRLKKAKEIVHFLFIRKECRLAYLKNRRFRKLAQIFHPWYKLSKVLIIQRNIRIYIARQKMQRLAHIRYEIRGKLSRKYRNLRERYFFYWKKFIYLHKRERLRAKKKILILYRYYKYFYAPLKRIYRHRYFAYKFKEIVYLRLIGFSCYTLKIQTTKQTQYNSINGIFQGFTKYYCFHGFQQWKEQIEKQRAVNNWLIQWRMRTLKAKMITGELIGMGTSLCSVNRHYSGVISTMNSSELNSGKNDDSSSNSAPSTPNTSPITSSRKRNSIAHNMLSRRLSYQANYPWEMNSSRSKVLVTLSQRLLFQCLFHWNQRYRLHYRIAYFHSSALAVATYQAILDGMSQRQECSILIQRQIRRYLAYHNVFLPRLQFARKAEELGQHVRRKGLYAAFYNFYSHFNSVMDAKARIKRFILYQRERQKRMDEQLHCRNAIQYLHSAKSKFFQRVVRTKLIHWIKRFCEQVMLQKVTTSNYLQRYEKQHKLKREQNEHTKKNLKKKKRFGIDSDTHHGDDDGIDQAIKRFEDIEEYQQRLLGNKSSTLSDVTPGKKAPFSTGKGASRANSLHSKSTTALFSTASVGLNRIPNSLHSNTVEEFSASNLTVQRQHAPKRHSQVVDSLTAAPLYFQSEAFHTLYYQLKSSQGFLMLSCDNVIIQSDSSNLSNALSATAKSQAKSIGRRDMHQNPKKLIAVMNKVSSNITNQMIALQETYFLFQQTKQLVIQLNDRDQSLLLQSLCESFQGDTLLFYRGEFFDSYLIQYMEDFLSTSREKYYSIDKFNKSLWPLTLPSTAVHSIIYEQPFIEDTRKAITLHFQEVTISIVSMIIFCHILQLTAKAISSMHQHEDGSEKALRGGILSPSMSIPSHSPLEAKFYPHCYLNHIRELKMDIQSTGQLGLCVLLHTIQYCPLLKTLIITNDIIYTNDRYSPSTTFSNMLIFALTALSKAHLLQDFRYYGIFPRLVLEGLQVPLQRQFNGLQKLCFSILKEDVEYADALIMIGKQRAYSSIQSGVSITVDVHN